MTDSSGTSVYGYDFQGRLTSYTPPQPSGHAAVTYTYNNLGQKTSITSGSYNVQYNYYANGWLKSVTTGSGNDLLTSYSYGPVGNRLGTTYGNTTSTDYDYDSLYRISSIIHKKGTSTLATIGYPTRDNAGSPEAMTDWTGEWSYDYDGHNRLTNAAPPNPVPEQMGGNYGYDWVGNRLSPPTGANMEYDAADRLINWPGMYSYSYYSDGSLEEVRNAQGTLVSSYTYHPTGLLYQASYMGNHTAVNTWDGSGNRVGLTINGKVCSFVYDPTAGIPAVIEEVVDGTPVYYYREPGGTLIARTDATNGIRYYHFDALGSTRLLTKANGDVTDKYAYDAWGTVVAHDRYEGSIDQPYQYVGQYGYYTHYQDSDFKLLQLGVRFYDTEKGRFTSRDPIKDGLNWYGYVGGNSITGIDPTGLLDSVTMTLPRNPELIPIVADALGTAATIGTTVYIADKATDVVIECAKSRAKPITLSPPMPPTRLDDCSARYQACIEVVQYNKWKTVSKGTLSQRCLGCFLECKKEGSWSTMKGWCDYWIWTSEPPVF